MRKPSVNISRIWVFTTNIKDYYKKTSTIKINWKVSHRETVAFSTGITVMSTCKEETTLWKIKKLLSSK